MRTVGEIKHIFTENPVILLIFLLRLVLSCLYINDEFYTCWVLLGEPVLQSLYEIPLQAKLLDVEVSGETSPEHLNEDHCSVFMASLSFSEQSRGCELVNVFGTCSRFETAHRITCKFRKLYKEHVCRRIQCIC